MNSGMLVIGGAAIAAIYIAAVLQHVGAVEAGTHLTAIIGAAILLGVAAAAGRVLG